MKSVQLTTTSGHNWKTSVSKNATLESVCQTFLGHWFNVGTYPLEKFERVVGLKFWDVDGSLIKEL